MKFYRKYWNLYFVFVGALIVIGDVIYWEIKFHYLEVYDGIVIEKQQIPPKKMQELLINGNNETFPMWKWEGVDFDSVKIGDSIVKRKYESNAYYYKRLKNGKFDRRVLKYWFP